MLRSTDIPDLIKTIIKQEGTQAKAAEVLGITQPTISRWLTGAALPDLEQYENLLAFAISRGLLPDPNAEIRAALIQTAEALEAQARQFRALADQVIPLPQLGPSA